jgi:ubiquinol-cytochrome c reductase cytochrome c subunit
MRFMLRVTLASIGAATLITIGARGSAQSNTGIAVTHEDGHALFETYCSVCHGTQGQGFIGPRVSGIPWNATSLGPIVRHGLGGYGGMPAFSRDSVSDAGLAAIASYLGSVGSTNATPTSSSASVAAPSATASATSGGDRGAQLYAANCASCHGAQGQGGFGPSLHNERSRRDLDAAVAWIKNPAPPMPKLYPSPLSDRDVEDVAAFIEKL